MRDVDEFFEDPFTSRKCTGVQDAFCCDDGGAFVVSFIGFVVQREW